MKQYLLSNCLTTEDEVKYILDTIKLYLTVHTTDIPLNPYGNEMNLLASEREEILGEIENALNTCISQINKDAILKTKLKGVSFDPMNNIRIALEIGTVDWEFYLNNTL